MAANRSRLRPLTLEGRERYSILLEGGERYPILLDGHGMPLWHVTLLVTTQLRNTGRAANTIMSVLAAIRSLLVWADHHSVLLEDRFAQRQFLYEQESEFLWRHLATRHADRATAEPNEKVVRLLRNADRG